MVTWLVPGSDLAQGAVPGRQRSFIVRVYCLKLCFSFVFCVRVPMRVARGPWPARRGPCRDQPSWHKGVRLLRDRAQRVCRVSAASKQKCSPMTMDGPKTRFRVGQSRDVLHSLTAISLFELATAIGLFHETSTNAIVALR